MLKDYTKILFFACLPAVFFGVPVRAGEGVSAPKLGAEKSSQCGEALAPLSRRHSVILEILDVLEEVPREKLIELLETGVGGVTIRRSSMDTFLTALRERGFVESVEKERQIKQKGQRAAFYHITKEGRTAISKMSRRDYQIQIIVEAESEKGEKVRIKRRETLKYAEIAVLQFMQGKFVVKRDELEDEFEIREWSGALLNVALSRLGSDSHSSPLIEGEREKNSQIEQGSRSDGERIRKEYWLTKYGHEVFEAWEKQKDEWLKKAVEKNEPEEGT